MNYETVHLKMETMEKNFVISILKYVLKYVLWL